MVNCANGVLINSHAIQVQCLPTIMVVLAATQNPRETFIPVKFAGYFGSWASYKRLTVTPASCGWTSQPFFEKQTYPQFRSHCRSPCCTCIAVLEQILSPSQRIHSRAAHAVITPISWLVQLSSQCLCSPSGYGQPHRNTCARSKSMTVQLAIQEVLA